MSAVLSTASAVRIMSVLSLLIAWLLPGTPGIWEYAGSH